MINKYFFAYYFSILLLVNIDATPISNRNHYNRWLYCVPAFMTAAGILAFEYRNMQSSSFFSEVYASAQEKLLSTYSTIKTWSSCVNESLRIPLFISISTQNIELLSTLLAHGTSPNTYNTLGETPLHCASRKDISPLFAKLLIEHNAVVDARNNNSETALHRACKEGNTAVVSLLLENNASIEAKNDHGETPFYIACIHNNIEIAQLLFQKGADIDTHNRYGIHPLFAAALEGNALIIHFFLDKAIHCNKDQLLRATCAMGKWEIALLLVKKGVNLYSGSLGNKPLDNLRAWCMRQGYTDKYAEYVNLLTNAHIEKNDNKKLYTDIRSLLI